ncbi:MAG TPA: phenylalanine--tRNA ligase beta subunit-related protein [Kofleriaceae bacterium]
MTRFAQSLGELAPFDAGAQAPLTSNDTVRTEIRQLLRHGGFKPAGRSKPASEYLVAAHAEGRFPQINAAVDACNVVSLGAGLPISLIDLDRVVGDLAIRICPAGTTYVFNPSGQTIDASGLLAVFDAEGPTGTPVKDAQRTKTHDATKTTLSIVWGSNRLPGRTHEATNWYRQLVASIAGTTLEDVALATA